MSKEKNETTVAEQATVANEKNANTDVDKDAEIERLKALLEQERVEKEKAMHEALPEERVKIKLFKDNKDYKDDVVVGLNGKIYQIQRGIEVEVPRGVAEILAHSQEQEERTAEMIEMLIAETEAKEKEINQ